MDVGEIEHLSILLMQINWINKPSIKRGGFQILQFFWCRNIHSHNTMFHHIMSVETLELETNRVSFLLIYSNLRREQQQAMQMLAQLNHYGTHINV
jgi:hypothetical protein